MRCRACNGIMTAAESHWYEEEKRHEDMCTKCRDVLLKDLEETGEAVEAHEEYIDALLGQVDEQL